MTPSIHRPRRRSIRAAALAPTAATAVLGSALATAVLSAGAASPVHADPLALVSACTPYSSGLAKDVQVKVTKAKPVSVKRLEVRKGTVKVRVRLAVSAIGTATGYGRADVCPGGVSNPQEVTTTVTWKGTRTETTDYTASGRTTKAATRTAVREATKLSRDAALRVISDATVRRTETVALARARAASETTVPSTGRTR